MKRSLSVLLFVIIVVPAIPDTATFTGEIRYKYSFTDLIGNDITERAGAALGREQHK